jgi:tetratricopeptide (TPR) repeat protein
MGILWLALFLILSIIQLALFVYVLIKLFKTEGVLKFILGLICGIYPFVWGWMKHKQLKLFKIMAIWTGAMVLSVLFQVIFMTTGVVSMLGSLKPEKMVATPTITVQKRVTKPGAKAVPKRVPQKAIKKPDPKTTLKPPSKPLTEDRTTLKMKEDQEYEMEMKRLNILIEMDKKNANAFYNRGWLYEIKGDLEKAEKDYTKAIGVNKRHKDAYYNRGLVYIRMKKYEQAIEDFTEAIKLKPSSVDAYCNRGNANFELGKKDLALEDYNAALQIDPDDADLYYNRAAIHNANGEDSKATLDLKKAAELGHNKARQVLGEPPEQPKSSTPPEKTSSIPLKVSARG